MDRLFIDGERYRFEDPQSDVITTIDVADDKLVFVSAENEAGDPVHPSASDIDASLATAAAMIKAGELRPLHKDER